MSFSFSANPAGTQAASAATPAEACPACNGTQQVLTLRLPDRVPFWSSCPICAAQGHQRGWETVRFDRRGV